MSFEDMREKYALSDEEINVFHAIERKVAFDELAFQIETYYNENKSEWNDGRELEPSDEEVEKILDAYLAYREEYSDYDERVQDMYRAIEKITGIEC